MKGFHNITNFLKRFVGEHKSLLVNIFFWSFLISFIIDRILNYFTHFPFFVVSGIIAFPFLFLAAQYKNPEKRQLYVLVFSFLVITIINSIVHLFALKNFSDFLFIGLFFTFYYYYKNNINRLKKSNVYLFLTVSLFLFSLTFVAIDSDSISKSEYTSFFDLDHILTDKSDRIKDISNKSERIKWESNELDIMEVFRVYHNGLFRLPHIASYFFGFLFLFLAFQYQKKKKVLDIVLLTASLAFCVYTGTRTILAAFILSIIIFLFKRKYIVYLQGVIIFILLLILGRQYLVQLTENTVFFQYFAFIQTTIENFTRLSRFRLWYSWWLEVREFGFWDLLIGKSYMNALFANAKNLDYKVWFHNDFLNILYSYGIGCAVLYVWFFIKIYLDNKNYINHNIFIFIFYISMVITAIINGFYYYFPVFLLYLFFIMINEERKAKKDKINIEK